MNVYEEAHRLAQAIKESGEYKDFMDAQKEIEGNEDLKGLIAEYKQLQLWAAGYIGENQHPEEKLMEMMSVPEGQRLNQLVAILSANPVTQRYMEAEMRLGVMVMDAIQVVQEAVPVGKPL